MEHHVDRVNGEQPRHVGVAGQIVLGQARGDQLPAAGGLQLLDHVASEKTGAAGHQHAGLPQLHAHRLMNSSTHSLT